LANVSDIDGNSSTVPAVPESTGVPAATSETVNFQPNPSPYNQQNNLVATPPNNLTNSGTPAAPLQPAIPVQPAAPRISIPVNATPEQIISLFIGALKDGDTAGANLLFTPVAQEQLKQHEIPFGDYPNSNFQIAQAQIEGNQAQVQCNMVIEVEGETYTVPGTWVLAANTGQWRIRGMVTGNPGRFLDFEKPENWVQELDESETRVAEQPQSGRPEDPTLQR